MILMFALGLVSSLHCVQMCGPIVLAYSVGLARERRGMAAAHACYNLGRITTYALLGALAGLAGTGVGFLAGLAGIANGARIAAGGAMIVAGLFLSGVLSRSGLVGIGRPPRFLGRLLLAPGCRAKFALGTLLGFLPCGLVYAALLKSMDAGGALQGALSMAAFGLGTSLTLAATGFASSAIGRRAGRWSNALAGAGVVAMGIWLLWRGLAPPCHGA